MSKFSLVVMRAGHPRKRRKPIDALKFAASPGKQIIAGVAAPQLLRRLAFMRGSVRRRDGEARDLQFAVVRSSRQVFDRTPVERAGGKVHVPKRATGGQDAIDQTIAFEQCLPINLGDHPQARHDVPDGYVRGALTAMHLAHSRICRHAAFCKLVVQPSQRGGDLRILIAKPMHELDREGLGKRLRATASENDRRRLRDAPADSKQSIRKAIGLMARGAASRDLPREPPQIFDQNDLQRY